jgi:hypothetical protein
MNILTPQNDISCAIELIGKGCQDVAKKEKAEKLICSSPLTRCALQAAKKAIALSQGIETLKQIDSVKPIDLHPVVDSRGTIIALSNAVFKRKDPRKQEEAYLYESIANFLNDSQIVQSVPLDTSIYPKQKNEEWVQLAKTTNTLLEFSQLPQNLQTTLLNNLSKTVNASRLEIFLKLKFPCSFYPDFQRLSPLDRKLYTTWSQDLWIVTSSEKRTSFSFAGFIVSHLQGQIKKPFSVLHGKNNAHLDSLNDGEQERLERFLALPWQVQFPRMETQAYISHTVSLDNLHHDPYLQKILENLNPSSFYSLIVAGLCQAQDLHNNNIVFRPCLKEEHSAFLQCRFVTTGGNYSFLEIAEQYQKGLFNDTTLVAIYPYSQTRHQIQELPELKAALSSPWEVVLWDLDFCLGESNELCSFTQFRKTHLLLPFLNNLIWQPIAAKPLPASVIERLKNIKNQKKALLSWMFHYDAPVFMHMRHEKRDAIVEYLENIMKKQWFRLGFWRHSHYDLNDFTIAKLQEEIINVLETDEEFWKLAGNIPKEKRKEFALSILPRLSWHQIQALLERIENLFWFLEAPSKLKEFSLLPPEAQKNAIEKFIKEHPLPLSTKEKKGYLSLLSSQNPNLEKITKDLFENLTPSLLSIYKVLYPLLADTLLLSSSLQEKYQLKTTSWGCYIEMPLDALLTKFMKSLIRSNPVLSANSQLSDFSNKKFTELSLKDIIEIFHLLPKEALGEEREALTALALFIEDQINKATLPFSFFYHC